VRSLLLDYLLDTVTVKQKVNSHFYHKAGSEGSYFFSSENFFSASFVNFIQSQRMNLKPSNGKERVFKEKFPASTVPLLCYIFFWNASKKQLSSSTC